ncbi:MAG: DUF4238 domain-containing protein [Candidatus Electrothrix sp. Rat3]|nr:DUF4238 domain-containing protein [Candidatus Electrothrix rattekaaiensis]
MKIDNHYLPKCHLKRWESSPKKVWVYSTLVSHENVPLWKERDIKGIAYRKYLYTRIVPEGLSDEIETFFDKEYETPAEEAIQKVVSNARLTPSDWKTLIRFLAVQRVRTPARLLELLQHWEKTFQNLLDNTLQEAAHQLESAKAEGVSLQEKKSLIPEYFPPVNVKIESDPVKKSAVLKAETVTGRGMWIFAIRHLLKTADVLHQHKWTVLSPPDGMRWFTSDDPVIQLNFHNQKYNFLGGWGSAGTEILLPISPQHLLYTQIGNKRPPLRGTRISLDRAQMINRFIAEHAHRMIFASKPDTSVKQYRPREVDSERFSDEESQWKEWHNNQTNAERKLME